MLDFTTVKRGDRTMNDLATTLTLADLRDLTNASIDRFASLLDGLTDDAVVFVPDDPDAHDSAGDQADRQLAWTLGHVVVHATASGEEYAAVAAEFARGVPFHGRPRYETPWQTMQTIEQCRERLSESRRIRLASLAMWPDTPHLDIGTVYWDGSGWVNAQGIFLWGLAHDADHERQLHGIITQARAAH